MRFYCEWIEQMIGELCPVLSRIPGHLCSFCKVQYNYTAEKMVSLPKDLWHAFRVHVRKLLYCQRGCQRRNFRHEAPLNVLMCLLEEMTVHAPGLSSAPSQSRHCSPTAGKISPVDVHGLCNKPPKSHSTPGFSVCSEPLCWTLANLSANLVQV